MATAYISLGSNLGNRQETCQQAVESLSHHSQITLQSTSSYYESQALVLDDAKQPPYINQVIAIKTSLTSQQLLEALLHIEKQFGRVRQKRWEARVLDLDILYYDDIISDVPELKIPHPEIHNRSFILKPLVEIAPHFHDPRHHKTMTELYKTIPHPQEVKRI
jgi:2-amino-4-hydroxy-6-hydroxymethyldihydropteridine diphosphokinase